MNWLEFAQLMAKKLFYTTEFFRQKKEVRRLLFILVQVKATNYNQPRKYLMT